MEKHKDRVAPYKLKAYRDPPHPLYPKQLDTYGSYIDYWPLIPPIICCNAMGKGTHQYERVGRKIMNIRFQAFMRFTRSSQEYNTAVLARVYAIYDRQCNGVLPTYEDIFEVGDWTGPGTNSDMLPIGPIQREQVSRYYVLYDKKIQIGGSDNQNSYLEIDVPVNLATIYNADSSGIASVTTGALYLGFCSMYNVVTYCYYTRLTYDDR